MSLGDLPTILATKRQLTGLKLLPYGFNVSVQQQFLGIRVHDAYSTQPNFLPEFQGGSYNPWGGPEGGCPDNTGPNFANLIYRHNFGQRVIVMRLYMLFGGTSWGSFAAPAVGKSSMAAFSQIWSSSVVKQADSLKSNKLRLFGSNFGELPDRRQVLRDEAPWIVSARRVYHLYTKCDIECSNASSL